MLNRFLLLAGASSFVLASGAHAAPITNFTENLTTPIAPAGSSLTPVALAGVTTPFATTISGSGYNITFQNTPSGDGVVRGTVANLHATPVSGGTAAAPTYLTGDFGSASTTNVANSGNYFSTGGTGSSITITFATPETSLALLWGSIDTSNLLTLSGGSIVGSDTLTGVQLQAIAGFAGNGAQGFDGSAFVSLTDTAFTTVTLSSGVPSFEAQAIVGSNAPFVQVPEPMSLALFGASLASLGLARRFFRA